MYETPLFLAHEEESGGRSVPTTPLQVAAPGEPNLYRFCIPNSVIRQNVC